MRGFRAQRAVEMTKMGYVAVFAPLLIEDDAELRARAATLWHRVQAAAVPAEVREVRGVVLGYWFFPKISRAHREGDLGDAESGDAYPGNAGKLVDLCRG